MRLVYEASLFEGVGGGARHYEGMFEALRAYSVEPLAVLPVNSSVDINARDRIDLPCRGGRLLRMISYEAGRALLLLKWAMTRQRCDVWMARHSLLGVGLVLARLVSDVVVLEVNGPVREEIRLNFGSRRLAVVADWFFRRQIAAADLVVAVSPGLADYVRARAPKAAVVAIPNGAKAVSAGVMEKADRMPGVDLVFSGAVAPWYDLDTVLAAVQLLRDEGRDLRVKIVGEGSERDRLQRTALSYGLADAVEFTGWLEADDAQAHVLSARVGLLPMSSKSDGVAAIGSPLKLYEYGACSLPVVAPDMDGISNSPLAASVFVYVPGDSQSCARAIGRALGAPAVENTREDWSWDSRAQSLLAALGRIGRKVD